MKFLVLLVKGLIAGSLIGLFLSVPVQAEQCIRPGTGRSGDELNRARICSSNGQVSAFQDGNPLSDFLGKVLQPPSRLTVEGANSKAALLFNEGTFARFLPNAQSKFKADLEFIEGLKRINLNGIPGVEVSKPERPNLTLAPTTTGFMFEKHYVPKANSNSEKYLAEEQSGLIAEETIFELNFELNKGTVLTMNPSNSVLTEIRTPGNSRVELGAALSMPSSQNQDLLQAPTRGSAVIVRHDSEGNTTQVFSLTNSGIRVFGQDENPVVLQGGETVSVTNGILSPVQTFDLLRFYQTTQLANGLGPGQEEAVAAEPTDVQQTIRAVRVETLSALESQRTQLDGRSDTALEQPLLTDDDFFNDDFFGDDDPLVP